jgi:hypothetical protein
MKIGNKMVDFNYSFYRDKTRERFIANEKHHFDGDETATGAAYDEMMDAGKKQDEADAIALKESKEQADNQKAAQAQLDAEQKKTAPPATTSPGPDENESE